MKNTFKKKIEKIFYDLKRNRKTIAPPEIEATLSNGRTIRLFVITEELLKRSSTIAFLASWRKKSNRWFPSQFQVTLAGTKKWAKEQLLDKSDRILFFFQAQNDAKPFGHAGFYRFDFENKSCELDNIIRGRISLKTKGGMTRGLEVLTKWGFEYLGLQKLDLRVFADNNRAVALYKRLGFREIEKIPLLRRKEKKSISWVEAKDHNEKQAKRFFVKMSLEKI